MVECVHDIQLLTTKRIETVRASEVIVHAAKIVDLLLVQKRTKQHDVPSSNSSLDGLYESQIPEARWKSEVLQAGMYG